MSYSDNIKRLEELTPKLGPKHDTDALFDVMKHANDLIAIIDSGGIFVYVNDKWEKSLGYTRDELIKKPLHDFIHPDDLTMTRKIYSQISTDSGINNFINRYKTKGESYVKVCWSASPYVNGMSYAIGRTCPLLALKDKAS